ncbi:plasmid stabilization protein StbC [Photorhabdus sp. RM71S]|uniref:plasmid stabilization protein StbC n=1 Tax=Photorhabdus sp. RM71S TaxID=3342824 RepID=UPI0036DF2624
MDKQPDKLDVLMGWFLGDAKEINEAQEAMLKKQAELLQHLEELNGNLVSAAEEVRRDMKEESKARAEFLSRWQAAQRTSARNIINRVVIVTAVCSVVGAAIVFALIALILK